MFSREWLKRVSLVEVNLKVGNGDNGVKRGWFTYSIGRVVGNGTKAFFWKDNWVEGVSLRERFPRL